MNSFDLDTLREQRHVIASMVKTIPGVLAVTIVRRTEVRKKTSIHPMDLGYWIMIGVMEESDSKRVHEQLSTCGFQWFVRVVSRLPSKEAMEEGKENQGHAEVEDWDE